MDAGRHSAAPSSDPDLPARIAPGPWPLLSRRPLLLSSTGAALLGFTGLLFHESHTSPATATAFRAAYALPALLLLVARERAAAEHRWSGSRLAAWAAGVMLSLDLVLWLRSVDYIGAGLATVLGSVQLVFVVLASAAFLDERLSARLLGGIVAMCGGVVLISGMLQSHPYGSHPGTGALLAVVGGVLYGAYIMLMRRASDGEPSVLPLTHATAASALSAIVLGLLLGQLDFTPPGSAQVWLVLLALSGQVLAWLLLTVPASLLPASTTSIVLTLQPVAGLLVGVVLLEESPTLLQLLGVLALIAGFVVALRSRRLQSRPSSSESPAPAMPVASAAAGSSTELP